MIIHRGDLLYGVIIILLIIIAILSFPKGTITGEIIADPVYTSEGEIDCLSMWDCSAVEFSECEDNVRLRELEDCLHPDPNLYPECWDKEIVPDYKKDCIVEEFVDEAPTEEVPFFTWINLILVSFILTGYYYFRKS